MASKLPAIPRSVYSVLGLIPVERHESVPSSDGKPSDDLGWWDAHQRTIRLRKDMPLVTAHHTLLHEKVHVWLWDAGVQLSHEVEENIADVIATALLAEMMNR